MSLCSITPASAIFAKSQCGSTRSDFTRSEKQNELKWYCNICTPWDSAQIIYMSLHAAQHHERYSIDHAHNVIESEIWWNPPPPDAAAWNAPIVQDPYLTLEERKIRDSRAHVDHVWDMVPFWIRGIEAAERGEMLKLEQFLETLQIASDTWPNAQSDNPWADVDLDRGWGDAWEIEAQISENHVYDRKIAFKAPHVWSANGKTLSSMDTNSPSTPRTQQQLQSRINNGPKLREKYPEDAYEFVEEVARRQAAGDERKQQMHIFFNVCGDRLLGFPTDIPVDAYA